MSRLPAVVTPLLVVIAIGLQRIPGGKSAQKRGELFSRRVSSLIVSVPLCPGCVRLALPWALGFVQTNYPDCLCRCDPGTVAVVVVVLLVVAAVSIIFVVDTTHT